VPGVTDNSGVRSKLFAFFPFIFVYELPYPSIPKFTSFTELSFTVGLLFSGVTIALYSYLSVKILARLTWTTWGLIWLFEVDLLFFLSVESISTSPEYT